MGSFETCKVLCKRFQIEHSWWSDATFHNSENKTLRYFIKRLIESNTQLINLIENGTEDMIEDLFVDIAQSSYKMLSSLFSGILDKLYQNEKELKPFSKDLVKWYRKMNWKFPEFDFEKESIEIIDSHTTLTIEE